MTTKIIIKRINMPFTFTSGISVEESAEKKTIISGTLLREGTSRNGNIYTLENLEEAANSAVGVPLFYGTQSYTNKHIKDRPAIGKIIRTFLDKATRTVKFWAQVDDKDIAKKVAKGWAVSIGGKSFGAEYILDEAGKIFTKLRNLVLNHVQLFDNAAIAGVVGAGVEKVVSETMEFQGNALTNAQITAIVTALRKRGKI
jgi:hypothetical protein